MITTHRLLLVLLTTAFTFLPSFSQGTWEPITPALYGGRASEILRDHDGRLWTSYGAYVWRSSDDGRTWEQRSPNIEVDLFTALSYRIAAIKGPGGLNLIALYPAEGQSNTIYISPTNGLTWQEAQVPEAFQGARLYVLGLSSGPALGFVENEQGAACLSSTDGGNTWTVETNFSSAPRTATESADGFVYCYDEPTDVIRRRAPDGTWTTLNAPAPRAMVALVAGGERILAVTAIGFFVSTNAGTTWRTVTLPEEILNDAISTAVGYAGGSFTLVTGFNDDVFGSRVSRTLRLPPTDTTAVVLGRSLPYELDNPIAIGPTSFIAGDDPGPVVSDDRGSTLERRVNGISMNFIWRFAISGNTILATTVYGELYRTSLNGTSWERLSQVPRLAGDLSLRDVVSPAPGTFVISTRAGILRSTDDGATWDVVPNTSSFGADFLTVRTNGDLLVPDGKRIAASSDDGATWTTIYDSGNEGPSVRHIAERANGGLLFTSSNRLYRIDGTSAIAIDSTEDRATFAVASPTDANVFGYLSGDDEPGPRTIHITRDGGATWNRGTYVSVGGSDDAVFDAVMNADGVLFTSNIDGLASMRPTDTEVTFARTNNYRFPVALHVDGSALLRSTASYIERNATPVSVDNEPASASPVIATPNPVRDVLTVRSASVTDEHVKIIDLLGVVQRSTPLVSGAASVSVDGLAPGWYLVRTESFTQAIVIQR